MASAGDRPCSFAQTGGLVFEENVPHFQRVPALPKPAHAREITWQKAAQRRVPAS